MRHPLPPWRRFARRLVTTPITFTAKDAKDAKSAKEEQLLGSFSSLAPLAPLASLASFAVKLRGTPPGFVKANP